MGTNTLTSRTDGNRIPASDHNELVQALLVDVVPRNNSRVPTDISGSLGTSVLRWLRAYVQTYHVGAAANSVTISESSGELTLETDYSDLTRLVVKPSRIEFTIEGSLIVALGETSLTAPDKYIDHDALKTNDKVKVNEFTFTDTGDVNDVLFSETLSGCISGKVVIIDYSLQCDAVGDEGDLEFYVTGTSVSKTLIDDVNITNGSTNYYVRRIFKYTIPNDGNFTFSLESRQTENGVGACRIEEV